MATFQTSILGVNTREDNSGNVFVEPFSVKATNDLFSPDVAIFNDSGTRIGLRGVFRVPQNYVGSPAILIEWTSTATSGNVVWDFDYRAIATGESLDPSTVQEAATVTDAAPASAMNRESASISLTGANLAAGDLVLFELFRDGANGSDTMAAAAILMHAYFQYADA